MDKSNYNNELKTITKGAGITAFSLVFMNLMAFVNNAVITRTLGTDQYGLYVLATRVFELVVIASMLGFRPTIVKFLSSYIANNKGSFIKGTFLYCLKILILTSILLAIIVTLFSSSISDYFFNKPELSFYLKLLMIIVPAQVMLYFFASSMQGIKLIKQQVLVTNVLLPLLFFILITVFFIAGLKLNGVIYAHILTVIIIAFILFLFVNQQIIKPNRNKNPRKEVKEIWKFSVPLYFNSFIGTAIRISPILIMGYYLSNTDIGIYNVALKIAVLVFFIVTAFTLIFSPTISELFAKGDKSMVANLSKTVTKWIFTISLMVFALLNTYNIQVLNIFGHDFTAGNSVLFILLFAEIINSLSGLSGSIILMSGRSNVTLVNSIISFVLIISLTVWLTPIYGNIGPAIAYLVNAVILNSLRILELYYYEKIHPFRIDLLKPLAAGVLAFVIIQFLPELAFLRGYGVMLLGTAIFGAVYIGILLILRLSYEDKFILNVIAYQLKLKLNKSKKSE